MTKSLLRMACRDGNVCRRIILPVACTVLLLAVSVFWIIIPHFRTVVEERMQEEVHGHTTIAWSMLTLYHKMELRGDLSRESAQARAIARIRGLRYGSDMKDYFWINDTIPVMIMHPYRGDLEGCDVGEFTDSNGKRLFIEFTRVAKDSGEGYVDYMWQWKDDSTRIVSKVSFVRLFEPWGWIIGTGKYTDDIQAEISKMNRNLVLISVAILAIAVLLSVNIVRQGLRVEQERRSSQEEVRKLSRAVEQSSSVIIITDTAGDIEYVNPKFYEVTGYASEEIIGVNPRLLKSGKTSSQEYRDLWRTIASGRDWHGELANRRKNGDIYWAFAAISPVKNELGEVTHFIGIQEDITGRKTAEKELAEYNLRLELTNQQLMLKRRELEEFLYAVSHDLKAPVVSIQGFARLMQRKGGAALDKTLTDYLDRIIANSDNMESLLGDLLDLSRIGRIEEEPGPINLGDMVGRIIDSFAPQAAERQIAVVRDCPLPPVFGRHKRIRQVLMNLIDNAVKYMPDRDGARVSVGFEAGVEPEAAGVFYVRDNGEGIAEDFHARIFQMFQRARCHDDTTEGSGIGLAIVKRIIESHGGNIWLRSRPGQGATFFFTLPAVVSGGDNDRPTERPADASPKRETPRAPTEVAS